MIGRRRSTVVAALLALVMALASPASALVTVACPANLPSGGFSDLGGMSPDAVDAIDCVAHYGIAQGTSTTSFSPNNSVMRWQMALFLTRTVTALGVGLPSGATQGFTDIGGLGSSTQVAINQIRQLGISLGTSSTTFNPFGVVPRWQMALFLTRLLDVVNVSLPNGASQGFIDISTLPVSTQIAINQLKQLEIAFGTSTTAYSPFANVLRWQMALFLARSLETADGSPYRLTASLSAATAPTSQTVVVTVTVRNPDGTLAANRRVDLFVASSLNSSGRCVVDVDAHVGGGDAGSGTNCTIDTNDPLTSSNGVATFNLTHDATLEVDTVYAWTGTTGAVFDLQDVRGEVAVQLTWVAAPTGLTIPANIGAGFGTTASVKAQLIGPGGAAVNLAGQNIRFMVTRGGQTVLNQTVITLADGSATLNYVGPADPSTGDDPVVVDTVTAFWDKDKDAVDDGADEFDDTGTVTWDDLLPPVTTATLSQSTISNLVGEFASISITVRDKFNQPVVGADVTFETNQAGPTVATTNAAGVATFGYTVVGAGLADSIDASVDLNGDGDVSDTGDLDFADVANLTHYWVAPAPTLSGTTTFDLIDSDAGANTIDVVSLTGSSYYRLVYDSGDVFNVDGGGTEDLAAFESAITGSSHPALDGAGGIELITNPYTPTGVSSYVLNT
ncbi:MAG: S-layer homology domain-containing protein [Acidimicrobiia bacterium]